MRFESRHITVTADHGTATLAFGFGGEPANALNLARLREFEAALDAVSACPSIAILIVRSAVPGGFCGGLCPVAMHSLTHRADRAAFAWYGQRVMEKLALLEVPSIAVIDGPCLGVGFELALACEYRLCVARSTTQIGFPERITCFGGVSRLRALAGRWGTELIASGRIISTREAQRRGIVDVACSERRAKIELRSFLDRVEAYPVRARRSLVPGGFAVERRAFSIAPLPAIPDRPTVSAHATPPFPNTIGLIGNDPRVGRFAAAASLRGASVIVCGDRSGIFAEIAESARRGFITPLEAELFRVRVRASESLDGFEGAGLVFVAEGNNPFRLAAAVRPRTIVCVVAPTGGNPPTPESHLAVPFPFPRRLLRISFGESERVALFPDASTDSETPATVVAWLKPFGYTSVVFPVAARLLPRAA